MLRVESYCVDAQANAASALQTLSFQPDARRAVVKAGGPARLLAALPRQPANASTSAAEARLQQRLVGALHNLSSGADGIAAIRRHPGGISALVSLLPCRQPGVAAAAAGALHNLCREEQARLDIRSHPDALPGLAAVLTGSDTQNDSIDAKESKVPFNPAPAAGSGVRCWHAGQLGGRCGRLYAGAAGGGDGRGCRLSQLWERFWLALK
ncbi:hypothetical protein ACK3TF_000467 [Chlorella vulgaris]